MPQHVTYELLDDDAKKAIRNELALSTVEAVRTSLKMRLAGVAIKKALSVQENLMVAAEEKRRAIKEVLAEMIVDPMYRYEQGEIVVSVKVVGLRHTRRITNNNQKLNEAWMRAMGEEKQPAAPTLVGSTELYGWKFDTSSTGAAFAGHWFSPVKAGV